MAQDDDGPVVVVGGSVLESMHDTVERRMEWGSGSQREIESDMDRTRLGSWRAWPIIDQSRLVISPGTDRRAALGKPALFLPTHKGQGLPAAEIAALPTRTGSMRNMTYFPFTPQSDTDFDGLLFLQSTAYNRGGPVLP